MRRRRKAAVERTYRRGVVVWAAAMAAAGCGPGAVPGRAPAPGEATLLVMTYNVNYGLAGAPAALQAIREAGADLVLLQETTPEWEAAIRAGPGQDYPTVEFLRRPAAGGMALLSRFEVTEAEVLEPPAGGWFPAWRLVLRTPLGPLQVLGVHLRPMIGDSGSPVSGYFTTGDERLAEVDHHLKRLDPDLPTLLLGDFNESPGGDALDRLEDLGFHSAVARFEPGHPTWRWPTSFGEISFQLDHLVHDPRLEPLEVRVLEAGRSDHLPVIGRFALSSAEPSAALD